MVLRLTGSWKRSALLRSKVIVATRDLSAATGNVAYTGVGFAPRAIIGNWSVDATATFGFGMVDLKLAGSNASYYGSNLTTGAAGTSFITAFLADGAADKYQTAALVSADIDGFTLSWTKTGAPTGTLKLSFLCLN
jgi:hypothetical protein